MDRLAFTSTALLNGATVYQRPAGTEFTTIYLTVPVGAAHSGMGGVIPGSPHFLEHLMLARSRGNPDLNEFEREVGLAGGWTNAHTATLATTYELSAPNHRLAALLPRFFSTVFEPLFSEADLGRQRGIIAAERDERRWWPADSELHRYLRTGWTHDLPHSRDQIFGSDSHLTSLTPEGLASLHASYLTPGLTLLAVGSGDLAPLTGSLEGLPLTAPPLPVNLGPYGWKRRAYHERPFVDLSSPILFYGGLRPGSPDPAKVRAIRFILRYLTNATHGPLWHWLRLEKGWVYDFDWAVWSAPWGCDWRLEISTGSPERVAEIRRELPARAFEALGDKAALNREVDRVRDAARAYDYETVDDTVNGAWDDLQDYGRIYTEEEWYGFLEPCRETSYVRAIFEEEFGPAGLGEFCAMPGAS